MEEILLGTGTFGSCRKMYYRGLPVAVKEFHPGLSSCSDVQKEAQLMSELSHPGIPFLFGVCSKEEPHLLISSFYEISGKSYTLHNALLKNSLKLTLPTWAKLLNDLAKSVHYLNNKGYVHRDIKADNILISFHNNDYHAILIDFGKCIKLSCVSIKKLSLENQELYKKNHKQIAPEIVNGTHPPSGASDIYSLGRIFKHVAVKFSSEHLMALAEKCTNEEPKERPLIVEICSKLQALN